VGALLYAPPCRAQGASSEQAQFFEQKIRPVLAERCYACHGARASKVQGGLLLDTAEGLRKGGNSGPAVAPGNPDASLLIRAIRYSAKELQMPPGGALPPAQIADFEQWVKAGAPDPREGALPAKSAATSKARSFWSFQRPKEPDIPEVRLKDWVRTPVDAFILARLEAKGLQPSPPADKRTLIRRATYDLIGLPPTPAEIDDFLADTSPAAFERVVDRLLASPHYGERWGRHWLDVARYADTKTSGARFPYSYTYRDWVIRAFNNDLPYDEFLKQQIAADLLPQGDPQNLAALGFITLGRDFPKSVHEMIDDRIDVISRGTLGLTVSCARCHDHKYDPIPTRDYYSLYGIISAAHEPGELPLISTAVASPRPRDVSFETALKRRREVMAQYRARRYAILMDELRTAPQISAYLLSGQEARSKSNTEIEAMARDRDLNLFLLRRWKDYVERTEKERDPVLVAWHAFAAIPAGQFAAKSASVTQQLTTSCQSNRLVCNLFAKSPPSSLKEVAERYGKLVAGFAKSGPAPDPDQEAVRLVLFAAGAPMNVAFSDLDKIQTEGDNNNLGLLRNRFDTTLVDYAYLGSPPRAMSLADDPSPPPAHVFVRGNPNNPGAEVPRRFLTVLSGEDAPPFRNGSGRLDLANAIATSDNPLTARVMVNRVWQHHFGAGLVRTPSDFGLRGERPSHPELLDYLALRFVEGGWSVKKLHRVIMLSSVYRQGSGDNVESRRADPENTLLWRMNRQRLDFESMRDSMLAVSGQLDRSLGGVPVSLTARPFSGRRTVYGFIDRARLPNMLASFDFASPEQHSPMRYQTTVPQQALFLMNSPFIVEQARSLCRRPEIASGTEPGSRVLALYRAVYGRAPTAEEAARALRFVSSQKSESQRAPQPPTAWQCGLGEWDEAAHRVKNFEPFRYFTGDAWQPSAMLPDPRSGNAHLTAEGGQPSEDSRYLVIRRWVVPRDGTLGITGALQNTHDDMRTGDGVRGRIVSSRAGELASWVVWGVEAETRIAGLEVKQGEVIDFTVDGRGDPDNDAFSWSPAVQMDDIKSSSRDEFRGPPETPLNAWERYAQVLLGTNEFAFVD
jgi:mono/diheme cytochrome c family protein